MQALYKYKLYTSLIKQKAHHNLPHVVGKAVIYQQVKKTTYKAMYKKRLDRDKFNYVSRKRRGTYRTFPKTKSLVRFNLSLS